MDANELLQQLANMGDSAEATASPSTVITNVPSVQEANPSAIYIAPKAPKQTAPVVDPYTVAMNAVKEASVDITNATSYEEKQRKIMDLRTAAMTLVETAHGNAVTQAEAMYNLPDLRKRYSYAQKEVQKNPAFQAQFAAFEKTFQNAEVRAQAMAEKMVKANPKLQTFIKTVDGEIQLQSKMAEKGWDRQQRMLDKEEQQKEAAADILAGMSGTVRETLVTQFPGLKDDVAMAKFLSKDGHGKDWLPVIQGTIPPEDYLKEGLLGNQPARMMAVLEQQKRTGLPIAVVKEDLNYAQRFVQDSQFMAQELIQNKLATPEEVKNMVGKGMLDTTKAGQEKLKSYALSKVSDALFARTKNRIDSDITSWQQVPGQPSLLSSPEAAKVFETLSSNLGTIPGTRSSISIADFSRAFIADAKTNEEKLSRQALISDAYSGVLAKQGAGIFHMPMNQAYIADQQRRVKTATTIQAITNAGKLGQGVRDSFAGASDLMPLNVLTQTANEAYKPILSTLDEFVNGLLQGGKK